MTCPTWPGSGHRAIAGEALVAGQYWSRGIGSDLGPGSRRAGPLGESGGTGSPVADS